MVSLVAASLLFSAAASQAQVWGVWSNPAPVEKGAWVASGHFLAGDLLGLMGHVRTGLNEQADVGIQIGLPDFDDAKFGIGGDIRFLIIPASAEFPVDLSADGAIGYTKVDAGSASASLLNIDFGAIVRKPFETQSGMEIVPYGSLMFIIGRASAGGNSNTNFDVSFRGGVDIPLTEVLTGNGELALGSDVIFVSFGAGYHF